MNKKPFFTLAVIVFSSPALHAKIISIDEGKAIFTGRCAACHNINVKVVGPALANVDQRHSIEWIIHFIHSSQYLIKNNDKQAVALFAEFNQVVMPDHSDLSGDQVKSIIEYIKSQTKATSAGDEVPFARPGKLLPNYIPVSITNYAFFGIYIAFVVLMAACLVVAVKVKEIQRQNGSSTTNEPVIY